MIVRVLFATHGHRERSAACCPRLRDLVWLPDYTSIYVDVRIILAINFHAADSAPVIQVPQQSLASLRARYARARDLPGACRRFGSWDSSSSRSSRSECAEPLRRNGHMAGGSGRDRPFLRGTK